MDADLLRLILFLAGVGLILGIYYWDRHKKVDARVHAIKRARDRDMVISPKPTEVKDRQEPSSAGEDASQVDEKEDIDEALERLERIVSESSESKPAPRKTPSQSAFSFAAREDGQKEEKAPEALPQLILQLNIVAKSGKFAGEELLKMTKELGLQYGDMAIYHRRDASSGKTLFSMASLVEPGTFPQKKMAEFSTPGVTLFAQLPGPQDGLMIFSDMLFTAERIAGMLSGEIQDRHHSDLTKQTIGHIREQILEHRRQVQLAKSRR